jgi:hypothetical protein
MDYSLRQTEEVSTEFQRYQRRKFWCYICNITGYSAKFFLMEHKHSSSSPGENFKWRYRAKSMGN